MSLSVPLAGSYPNNCSETQNCDQNIDIIALIFFKGMKSMVFIDPLEDSKTNNSYEKETS